MRSERIASLSRFVMVDALNPAITSATQWFERTLDDSANKRLSVPEGFLAVDGILDLCLNVVDGLVVYPKVIEKHLRAELPFMATENIMMDAVKAGGDRQELHERIRTLSMEAGKNVKEKGLENNLLELIAADPAFNMSLEDLKKTMQPEKYTGRAKEQVEAFLKKVGQPRFGRAQRDFGHESRYSRIKRALPAQQCIFEFSACGGKTAFLPAFRTVGIEKNRKIEGCEITTGGKIYGKSSSRSKLGRRGKRENHRYARKRGGYHCSFSGRRKRRSYDCQTRDLVCPAHAPVRSFLQSHNERDRKRSGAEYSGIISGN